MFPYTLTALGSSINPTVWGRGIMLDLGMGGMLKHLERHLGLFLTNVVTGCVAGIAILFLILMLVQVCEAVEGLILSAVPYRIALGILIAVAVVVAAAFIPHMMKVHYFRYAIKSADAHLQQMYNDSHEKMKKDHDAFLEKSKKQLAQMKDYNDKLEAYKKETFG